MIVKQIKTLSNCINSNKLSICTLRTIVVRCNEFMIILYMECMVFIYTKHLCNFLTTDAKLKSLLNPLL